jgi:hypothetical protein
MKQCGASREKSEGKKREKKAKEAERKKYNVARVQRHSSKTVPKPQRLALEPHTGEKCQARLTLFSVQQ